MIEEFLKKEPINRPKGIPNNVISVRVKYLEKLGFNSVINIGFKNRIIYAAKIFSPIKAHRIIIFVTINLINKTHSEGALLVQV